MSNELRYVNNHGKTIFLTLTAHARIRFQQRWHNLYPGQILKDEEVDVEIAKWFSHAIRVKNISKKDRVRFKRHGKDTLIYRANDLTFVIQDASIVTIEISTRDKRYLNNNPPFPSHPLTSAEKPPYALPPFKIFAWYLDEQDSLGSVSLGSYESAGAKGDAQQLECDENFAGEIQKRFHDKCPTGKLHAVFVQLGKTDNAVQVLIKTIPG